MNFDYSHLHDFFKLIAPYITFATGIMVFFITLRNFSLTRGHKILSTYSIASGVNTKSYVHHLILENRKNKPEVIRGIYLQLGHHYVIELKTYEDELLILKPMEAIQLYFDRVSCYAISSHKLNIDQDLANEKISKNIIVNTTRGAVKTKSNRELVFMIGKMFKNAYFACISPYQYKTDNMICSDDMKYIVKFSKNKEFTILIDKNGEISPGFLGFYNVEKNAMKSKESVKDWFEQIIKKSKNNDVSIKEVLEVKTNENDFLKNEEAVLPYYSYLRYLIWGKIKSIIKDYEIKNLNKKHKQIRKREINS